MTETTEAPRNDAGEFTANTFGREYENAKAGFTTKKDDSPPEETHSDTIDGLKKAAADLALRRADAPIEISATEYRDIVGKPDLSEAVTAKQAARELSAMRGTVATFVEGSNLNNIAEQVDKARAEIIKARPESAAELGLNAEDIKAAKEADGDSDVAEPKQTRPDPVDSSVEGRRSKVAEMIQSDPEARAEVEGWYRQASETAEQYTTAVDYVNEVARQGLIDHIGELSQIPVDQWGTALTLLHQNGDPRVARALGAIQRVSQLSAAQAEIAQHRAIHERQQFVESTEREDKSLVEKIGEAAANEANAATLDFLVNNGIERRAVIDFVHRHPLIATAQARELIYKAAQFDKIKSTSKSMAPLPPVQRPGLSTGRSANSDSRGKIASLQAQLEGATGTRAAKLASQIRTLKRST